ncbi:hypothetical protein J6590_074622 [Homalodisca vitripennis]|nr:hypothetical protein J6590_074622 [Homalodisca vitripennis]
MDNENGGESDVKVFASDRSVHIATAHGASNSPEVTIVLFHYNKVTITKLYKKPIYIFLNWIVHYGECHLSKQAKAQSLPPGYCEQINTVIVFTFRVPFV